MNCFFQLSIFDELNKSNRGKNLIISPLSIFQILSLTANGVREITKSEMIKALKNIDIDTINTINYEILETSNEFTTIKIVNDITFKFMDVAEKPL